MTTTDIHSLDVAQYVNDDGTIDSRGSPEMDTAIGMEVYVTLIGHEVYTADGRPSIFAADAVSEDDIKTEVDAIPPATAVLKGTIVRGCILEVDERIA